jgi:hypothetical protein
MEVSGWLQVPTALLLVIELNPVITIEYEAEWAPEPVWMLWRREKSFVSAGHQTLAPF